MVVGKDKFALWLTPECRQAVESSYRGDQCQSRSEFIEKAKVSGVSGYLVKPIDEKSLIPSIELAVARSQDIHRLRKDYEKVSSRLEDRGVIEKAKGLVMAEQEMTEQQAYDYIRGLSLTKHLSMRKVSEMLLRRSGE